MGQYEDNQRNELSLSFKLNFELTEASISSRPNLPEHLRLVNLVSNFTKSHYRTKFELVHDESLLFVVDSKKSALYLNLSRLSFRGSRSKCVRLIFLAKNFVYSDAISRSLQAHTRFSMNVCLFNGESNVQNNLTVDLNNLNVTYRSLIIPILLQSIDDLVNFDYLVENPYVKRNFFYTVLLMSLTFAAISACLILIFAYLWTKKAAEKPTVDDHPHYYQNFRQSSSFASSSTSNDGLSDCTDQLKIRNDLSKNSLEKYARLGQTQSISSDNLNFNSHLQPIVPSSQPHLNSSFQNCFRQQQDARVPSCRQINTLPKNLNDSFNTSSTNLDKNSENNHGAYCLATGVSFSMTSNISSVTNSQFVDDYQMNIGSPVSSSSSSNVSYVMSPACRVDRTKLSLFDLTPNPQRMHDNNCYPTPLAKLKPGKKLASNVENLLDKDEIDENMKKWIFVNYNFNCNNQEDKERNKPTLLDTSSAMSNLMQIDSLNECII